MEIIIKTMGRKSGNIYWAANKRVIMSRVFYFEASRDIKINLILDTLLPQLVFGQIGIPDFHSKFDYGKNQCKIYGTETSR